MRGPRPRPPLTRFMEKVDFGTDGCWRWMSATNKGYGSFFVGGKRLMPAHRWIYEQVYGPVPTELQIDHLCFVRECVNPAHLEAVTPQVNNDRRRDVRGGFSDVTHCIHGHVFDDANTYRWKNGRYCRACRARRERDRRRLDHDRVYGPLAHVG